MKFVFYLFLFLFPFTSLLAQDKDSFLNKIAEDKSNLEMPKPYLRYVEFMKERAFPGMSIDRDDRIKAIKSKEKLLKDKNNRLLMHAQQPVWENIGPYNVGGRIKAIAVHPNDPDLVYIGAAAGGIWRSKDGGANWDPLFDDYEAIAVGALSIDPNDPDIIYAGTGEPVIGFAKDFRGTPTYFGYGIYKSTDGGDTWKYLALSNVGAFSRLYVHPQNSNLIYAGAVEKNSGFYISTDAGQTWNRTREDHVTDVAINPVDPNEVVIGVNGKGIFYSDDMGNSWENISGDFRNNCSRVSVQISESEPNVIFSLMEYGESDRAAIYRSENKGQSWTRVYTDNSSSASFFNGQGGYDNYISIHPENPSIVLAGGIDIWRSMNKGGGWSNVTFGYAGGDVHVDQQCIAFAPSNPSIVYAGNDGGMYKSLNAGQTWIDINNDLQVTQFYALGVDHLQGNVNYGGTQDNGTLGKINNGFWERVGGGDGFRTFPHPENSSIVYGETYYGNMWKINLDTYEADYFTDGIPGNDQGAWCSPFVPDHNNPGVFYHGRHAFYAFFGYGEWLQMSDFFETTFSAIGVGRANFEYLYAGTADGTLIFSSNVGENWTEVSGNGLIARFITDIETSYEDENVAYVTYSGFHNPHIYMTTNTGQSWENISNNLPDVPVSAIAINPNDENNLYVATDVGVFTTYDKGEVWLPFGKDLPNVPVLDLEFRDPENFDELILRAATHGRSMWQVVVPESPVTEPEITSPMGGEIYNSGGNELIAWYGFDEPVKIEFSYDNGNTWKEIASNVVGNNMLWKVDHYETDVARIKVSSQENQDQVLISNLFTIELLEKGGVIANGFVGFIPYGVAWDKKGGLWTTAFDDNSIYKLNPENFEIIKKIPAPGDSLFTDLTIDRDNGIIYLHQLRSTYSYEGGSIFIIDTNGVKMKEYVSPAYKYPIGLELVDGMLVVGDREYPRMLTTIDPVSGSVVNEVKNPYDRSYGPRGLCYDGEKYLYQVCTYFPGGSSLTEALLIKIDKENISQYSDSLVLVDENGLINARGLDFDNRDESFWITDYNGSLYKIAGFDYILDVEDNKIEEREFSNFRVFPNPTSDVANVSFKNSSQGADISIKLINVLGESIGTFFEGYIDSYEERLVNINISDIQPGVYYISVYDNDSLIGTEKLTIVK